jgi:single-strand DNA-binding protein
MFNYCFLTGEVLTEPELKCLDNEAVVIFELGAMAGRCKVGVIKIVCFKRLAVAAGKHIHQGDYVSVMGYFWYLGESEDRPGKEDPEIIALHMEFVRSDSHLLGPIFPNVEEED